MFQIMSDSVERVVMAQDSSGVEVEVPLVASRRDEVRTVVSSRETDRIRADDIVALAEQVSAARQLVKSRACDRLSAITQQIEYLHKKAREILEEASRDEDLHKIPCNMQKLPGRIYHLYERENGSRYFSMLSAEEWGCTDKLKEFRGSFRLEYDRSWTPFEKTVARDRVYDCLDTLISGNGNLAFPSITSA